MRSSRRNFATTDDDRRLVPIVHIDSITRLHTLCRIGLSGCSSTTTTRSRRSNTGVRIFPASFSTPFANLQMTSRPTRDERAVLPTRTSQGNRTRCFQFQVHLEEVFRPRQRPFACNHRLVRGDRALPTRRRSHPDSRLVYQAPTLRSTNTSATESTLLATRSALQTPRTATTFSSSDFNTTYCRESRGRRQSAVVIRAVPFTQ